MADTIKQQQQQQQQRGNRSTSPVGKSSGMGVSNNKGVSNDMDSPPAQTRIRVEGKGSDRDDSPSMRNKNQSRGATNGLHPSSTHPSSTKLTSTADGLRWIDLFPPEVIPATVTATATTTTTTKNAVTTVPLIASSSSSAPPMSASKSAPEKGRHATTTTTTDSLFTAKEQGNATVGGITAAASTLPAVGGASNGKPIIRPQSAHPLLREAKDKILADNDHNNNAAMKNAGSTATTRGRSLSPIERHQAQERLYRNTSHGTSHSSTTTAKGLVYPSSGVISSATLNLEPNGEEFISWGGGVADPPLPVSGINHMDETIPTKPRQVHPSIFFAQHRIDLNAETTQRRIQAIETRKKQLRPRNEVLKEVEANVDFSYIKRGRTRPMLLQQHI